MDVPVSVCWRSVDNTPKSPGQTLFAAADSSFNIQQYLFSKLPKVGGVSRDTWWRRPAAQRPNGKSLFFSWFYNLNWTWTADLRLLFGASASTRRRKTPRGERAGPGWAGWVQQLHFCNAAVELSLSGLPPVVRRRDVVSVMPRSCWTKDRSQLAWKSLGTPGGAAAAVLLRLLPTNQNQADALPRTTKAVYFCVCVHACTGVCVLLMTVLLTAASGV